MNPTTSRLIADLFRGNEDLFANKLIAAWGEWMAAAKTAEFLVAQRTYTGEGVFETLVRDEALEALIEKAAASRAEASARFDSVQAEAEAVARQFAA